MDLLKEAEKVPENGTPDSYAQEWGKYHPSSGEKKKGDKPPRTMTPLEIVVAELKQFEKENTSTYSMDEMPTYTFFVSVFRSFSWSLGLLVIGCFKVQTVGMLNMFEKMRTIFRAKKS